jgi:hypothetical protein
VFDGYNFKQVLKLRTSIRTSKLNSNCNRRLKCCKEIKERNVERQEIEGKPIYETKDRLKQITEKETYKNIEFYPRMRWHLASCGV